MSKDLTNSSIDRKNILNNNLAIQEVYKQVGFYGIKFEGRYRFTKQQIANYFEVDIRTIDRILENYKEELEQNGYEIFSGSKLKAFKEQISEFLRDAKRKGHISDIDVEDMANGNDKYVVTILYLFENEINNLKRTTIIGTFTYKAFLNIGMLLTGSEQAQRLRSVILDIVIDVLNKKLGGKTKYINQREEEFLSSAIREYNYRKDFTNALDHYIVENKFKYGQMTDKIYQNIFKENAKEYRQILKLNTKESVLSTMYSEVLDLIASQENGFAKFLQTESKRLDRKLRLSEAHLLFNAYASNIEATLVPLYEKARRQMASRDLAFREALLEKLKDYINEVSSDDYEKFLGERSMDLEKRLEDNKEVFKRLKDR